MKIPHKVRIKARVSYEILFSDLIKDDPDCVGLTDYEKKQIIIKNGLSETEIRKTYLHECIHSICHEWKIEMPHKSIYELETAVLKFLTLNKLI